VFDELQAQALVDRAYGIALNGAAHPTVAELKSDLLEAGVWPEAVESAWPERRHGRHYGSYAEDHNFD